MLGLSAAAASSAVVACSLLTDLDGLSSRPDAGAPEDAAEPADAGGVDAGGVDAALDVKPDASVSCRPGFTGDGCTTPCPKGTAGSACDFRLVLGLDIPVSGAWNTAADVPYSEDATASAGAFARVGYRLVLDAEEVWVELDAFTPDATRLGIPVDWTFDQSVGNVVVHSFAARQASILSPTAGNIEMWSNCYGRGANSKYDHDDDITAAEPDCYGSFQVHVAKEPVISFNRWTQGTGSFDIGIGRAPATEEHPDWTFSENAGTFQRRRLEIYVR